MTAPIGRIILYTKRMPEMVAFYTTHFGFRCVEKPGDRIVELQPESGGAVLMLHPAGKGQKEGQVLVKLVFDVEDVEEFCRSAEEAGLTFGPIHRADGYLSIGRLGVRF